MIKGQKAVEFDFATGRCPFLANVVARVRNIWQLYPFIATKSGRDRLLAYSVVNTVGTAPTEARLMASTGNLKRRLPGPGFSDRSDSSPASRVSDDTAAGPGEAYASWLLCNVHWYLRAPEIRDSMCRSCCRSLHSSLHHEQEWPAPGMLVLSLLSPIISAFTDKRGAAVCLNPRAFSSHSLCRQGLF